MDHLQQPVVSPSLTIAHRFLDLVTSEPDPDCELFFGLSGIWIGVSLLAGDHMLGVIMPPWMIVPVALVAMLAGLVMMVAAWRGRQVWRNQAVLALFLLWLLILMMLIGFRLSRADSLLGIDVVIATLVTLRLAWLRFRLYVSSLVQQAYRA